MTMGTEENTHNELSVTLSIMARDIVALSAQVTIMKRVVAALLAQGHEEGTIEDMLKEPPFPARFEDLFDGNNEAIDALRQTHRAASEHLCQTIPALAKTLREARALDRPPS